MGIYNALFTGSSGLSAFGEAVRVIGDNIANVNSLGFKAQNVVFSDVLSQTVGVTRSNIANQVGNGVRIGQITRDTQQGSIQNTTNPTDMAINGNGMFALKDPASGQTYYTRAGAFILDKNFNMIDGQGFVVQGWATDTTGAAVGNVTDVTFANLAAQAQPTQGVTAGVSIDSTAVILPTGTAFDPSNPQSFHYKTEVNVFDSLGNTHPVNLYYTKTADNTWNWQAGVNSIDLIGKQSATDTGDQLIVGSNAFNVANPVVPQGTLSAGAQVSGNTIFDTAVTINGTTIPAGTTVGAVLGNGVIANATGIVGAGAQVVKGNVLTAPATTTYPVGTNLPSAIPVGTVIAAGTTFNQATTINGTAYAAGAAVPLTTVATFSSAATSVAVTAGSVTAKDNQLMFGTNGELTMETGKAVSFPWNSAAPTNITFNFGNATITDAQNVTGTGLEGAVQMAGTFATRQMTRDGFTSGFLDKLETDSTGRIFGVFTNGQRRSLYQVALAKFPNDSVLNHVGNNLQQETISSGSPVLEKPGNGGMGSITPFGLEQSNVDLAGEFVKLIVVQRGYEANSKTIMTTDQMLSSLMQIKR
ncbi:MAG: flagellar hook-basal body complex protein [Mariprofundaceae bacterium]